VLPFPGFGGVPECDTYVSKCDTHRHKRAGKENIVDADYKRLCGEVWDALGVPPEKQDHKEPTEDVRDLVRERDRLRAALQRRYKSHPN